MTTTQLVGHTTSEIVGGLTPAMLGVLLLNVVGIGAAIYFLNLLISGQQQHLGNLLDVQKGQIELVLQHARPGVRRADGDGQRVRGDAAGAAAIADRRHAAAAAAAINSLASCRFALHIVKPQSV